MPSSDTPWEPLSTQRIAEMLAGVDTRWWLSGGMALDRWLGRSIRPRLNADVSVLASGLGSIAASLPEKFSAWSASDDRLLRLGEGVDAEDPHPVLVHDDQQGVWVLQLNVEDGASRAWVYKRDPRLQLPWERAVLDIDGIPTGAPEMQLVWKALRPRPEDDVDKDAVVAALSDDARAWYERAILTIHPHSSWSIHVRSPFAPGKASWNRKKI
ncbi:hypothetical protein [Microbacterium sp. PMB16]|uniref:hypothetical protein n=1 Tax=Microbacterium sp. PMB16 TaxID=3120157 RepID=UPI003F4C4B3D